MRGAPHRRQQGVDFMVSVAIEHLLARSSTLITHRENRPSLVLARAAFRTRLPSRARNEKGRWRRIRLI